jgi:hypothetical protein
LRTAKATTTEMSHDLRNRQIQLDESSPSIGKRQQRLCAAAPEFQRRYPNKSSSE